MLTLTRQGYIYVIHPDTGDNHSRHVQEREAVESAVNLSLELGREVMIQYDQTVAVMMAVPPVIVGDKPTAVLLGVAPRGRTMETHPPIKPGTPDIEIGLDGLGRVRDGMTVKIRPGTYTVTDRIYRGDLWANGVTIDATDVTLQGVSSTNLRVLELAGANEVWHGVTVKGGDRGVVMTGERNKLSGALVELTGRDGVYLFGSHSQENELRDVHVRNVGVGSGSGTNVADGVVATANSGEVTYGHTFVRVRVDNAPDDCLDLYRATACGVYACVVTKGGYHYERGDIGGDGGGIKLGGGTGSGANVVDGALAIDCKGEAIKANSAPLPVEIYRSTVVRAGQYAFNPFTHDGSVVAECVSTGSSKAYTGGSAVLERHNSWQVAGENVPLMPDTSIPPTSILATASPTSGPIGATDEALRLRLLSE